MRGNYRFHRGGYNSGGRGRVHPSDSVQRRVAELVERSKDGNISAEDQSELEDYLQLEHIMIMAKARARQHTQLGQWRSRSRCGDSSQNAPRIGVSTAFFMKAIRIRRIK